MKFVFEKADSFYKIFRTVEKIPDGKSVTFSIHPHNQFFKNIRRGKQLFDLGTKKQLKVEFITQDAVAQHYLNDAGFAVIRATTQSRLHYITLIYLFFFKIKTFHLNVLNQKDQISYLIFGLEIVALLWGVYFFYSIVVPSATIHIKPMHTVEDVVYNFRYYPIENTGFATTSKFINIPYYTAALPFTKAMSYTVQNLRYIHNSAKWQVQINNPTNKEFFFKPQTKLITDDGIIYRIPERTKVPPADRGRDGTVIVNALSLEKDDKDQITWPRGNIPEWSVLYIKNLRSSNLLKKITAVAITDFTGGTSSPVWDVTASDIAAFQQRILEHVTTYKKDALLKILNNTTTKPLLYEDMITVTEPRITTQTTLWSASPNVEGQIAVSLVYRYIVEKDLAQAVQTYLQQRPSESIRLIDIDTNSLTLFDRFLAVTGVYIIPTKVSTVRWYNFETDVGAIQSQVITKIMGKDIPEAEKLLLQFPDVGAVDITLSPFRYTQIPTTKSRINIDIVADTSSS